MPTTREKLTEAAVRRFYRDGFRNVGLDQVLSDVGISKTAFYKHFDCKEDLVLAALEMQNQWLQSTFRTMVCERGGDSPLVRLRAVFDVVDMIIESDEYQGCIFVNVAMEFPLAHDPVHVAAARHKHSIEELVFDLAVQASAPDPRALARELCLIMEGAYVTRQVSGDRQTIAIARRLADLIIASHLDPTRPNKPPRRDDSHRPPS
jgi:AcrR family transcriptional regulator